MIVWFHNSVNKGFKPPSRIQTFDGIYYEAVKQDPIMITWDALPWDDVFASGSSRGHVEFQNQNNLDKYRKLLVGMFDRVYEVSARDSVMVMSLD